MALLNDVVPKLLINARTDMQANPDHMGGHQPTIGTGHRFVHLGVHFFNSAVADLDTADTLFHLFLTPAHGTPNTECHVIFVVNSSLATDIDLYEGITGAAPTAVPLNSRRASTNVAEARVGSALTGYTGGVLIDQEVIGTTGGQRAGGSSSRESELILKPSTLYAVKLTSNANANRVHSRFSWYEIGANIIGG